MKHTRIHLPPAAAAMALAAAALLAACAGSTSMKPALESAPKAVAAQPASIVAPADLALPAPSASAVAEYRVAAAYHLYERNATRIYDGVMPHFLYAIGVLELRLDGHGNLAGMRWIRAPEHAPEVVAEIERTVRQAAPFPAPLDMRMSGATYIDTWLWDASGRFQLHTLSEGQGPTGADPRPMPPRPAAPALLSSLSPPLSTSLPAVPSAAADGPAPNRH